VTSALETLDTARFLAGFRASFLEMVRLLFQHLDLLVQKPLNTDQIARFGFVTKRIGQAFFSSTSGAADAVNIDFGFVGQIEVEDVGNVVDIDASAGDVGSDKNEHLAVPEILQRPGSGGLAFVTMNGIGWNPDCRELFCQTIRAVFCSCEHNTASHHLAFEQIDEKRSFVFFLHEGHVLFNAVRGRFFRTDVNANRVVKHLAGEGGDAVGHRGAEEQVLTTGGHQVLNAVDIVAESHVEHAVGFIKNKMLNPTQIHVALVVQVQQATGCCNEQIHASAKGFDLGRLAHSAKNHR